MIFCKRLKSYKWGADKWRKNHEKCEENDHISIDLITFLDTYTEFQYDALETDFTTYKTI